jgi:E3 ubiquitin-protein ligase RNF115/126
LNSLFPYYRFFLGNPGDYAWGREGLDAIVTQLLNQMDGTGPPPLAKDKIKEIPVVVITQDQVGELVYFLRIYLYIKQR